MAGDGRSKSARGGDQPLEDVQEGRGGDQRPPYVQGGRGGYRQPPHGQEGRSDYQRAPYGQESRGGDQRTPHGQEVRGGYQRAPYGQDGRGGDQCTPHGQEGRGGYHGAPFEQEGRRGGYQLAPFEQEGHDGDQRPPYGQGPWGGRGNTYGGGNHRFAWLPAPVPPHPSAPTGSRAGAPMASPYLQAVYRATWPALSEVGDADASLSASSHSPRPHQLVQGASSSSLVTGARQLVVQGVSSSADLAAMKDEEPRLCKIAVALLSVAAIAAAAAVALEDPSTTCTMDASPLISSSTGALQKSFEPKSMIVAKEIAGNLFVDKGKQLVAAGSEEEDDQYSLERYDNQLKTKFVFGLNMIAGPSRTRRARKDRDCYTYDAQGEFHELRGQKGYIEARPALGLGIVSGPGLNTRMEGDIQELMDLYKTAYLLERDVATVVPETLSLTCGSIDIEGVAPPTPIIQSSFVYVEELLEDAEVLTEEFVSGA